MQSVRQLVFLHFSIVQKVFTECGIKKKALIRSAKLTSNVKAKMEKFLGRFPHFLFWKKAYF